MFFTRRRAQLVCFSVSLALDLLGGQWVPRPPLEDELESHMLGREEPKVKESGKLKALKRWWL